MIFDGTLDRFPGLKFARLMAADTCRPTWDEFEVACQVRNNANCASKKTPERVLEEPDSRRYDRRFPKRVSAIW